MINTIDRGIYSILFKMINMKNTLIVRFISHLGSATILIMLCILLLIVIKNKKIPIIISINLASVYLINVIIKNIVARPRPDLLRLVYEEGYSFPSGHTMVATGFYGLLIYIVNKKIKKKAIKNAITISLIALIFLIGISRIYLGAHYATDVIGGFVIGTIYLILFIRIIKGVEVWKKSLQ